MNKKLYKLIERADPIYINHDDIDFDIKLVKLKRKKQK